MCCEYLHSSADETKLQKFMVAYKTMRSLNLIFLLNLRLFLMRTESEEAQSLILCYCVELRILNIPLGLFW